MTTEPPGASALLHAGAVATPVLASVMLIADVNFVRAVLAEVLHVVAPALEGWVVTKAYHRDEVELHVPCRESSKVTFH